MTPTDPSSGPSSEQVPGEPSSRVVTPDGEQVRDDGTAPAAVVDGQDDAQDDAQDDEPASRIEEPAKVMRIGGMIKRLLDEVRDAPLDDAARTRLAEIHERSLTELEDGLSPDLVEELHRITLPFSDEGVPSDAELRVAQAQLVGWLEGLFHGIQTALVAQQMAAQAQLSQMRALPPGAHAAPFPPGAGHPHDERQDGRPSPGQYL